MHQLATAMRGRGMKVERINICAGDRVDWPEPATDFRGRFRDWPVFFDNFLREHQITDILLFGDCRPYHVSARGVAALRGVRTYVLEEGYLRPHWMTLELDGVNGHSRLARNKDWLIEQARALPPEPYPAADHCRFPPPGARHRSALYRCARGPLGLSASIARTGQGSALMEAAGWGWKYLVRGLRKRQADEVLQQLRRQALLPLPVAALGRLSDPQSLALPGHAGGRAYVLESFARHAPEEAHLLIKAHPFDTSLFNWRQFIDRRARRLGIRDRVHFIDGGDLEQLAAETTGMVCVNSTSATLALAAGSPVCTLGEAIYKIPGLTFARHLDEFWTDPTPPGAGPLRRVPPRACRPLPGPRRHRERIRGADA